MTVKPKWDDVITDDKVDMGEKEEVMKSKREMMLERLKSRYPDKEFGDDEAMYGQLMEDADESERRIGEYRGREKSLTDMFNSDPRSAAMIMEMKKGGDPVLFLIRTFGDDITEVMNDPAKMEEVAAARKEYYDRVAEEANSKAAYEDNLAKSIAMIDKMQEERGLSDEQVTAVMADVTQVVRDAIEGKFTPETFDLFLKAKNYDGAVAEAEQAGEVRGRNTRIEEQLRRARTGDGTAMLDGKNGGGAGGARRTSIFDIAKEAKR